MATLRDIKNRITSVQSTRQITRTMEMVATAKLKRAQNRIESARPYALAMAEVLGNLVRYVSDASHPLLEVRDDRRRICVVSIVSDRGFAGAFNSNIIRMTERLLKDCAEQGIEAELITSGKKALAYFRYRGVEPAISQVGVSGQPGITDARMIADHVISEYEAGAIDAVYVLFNRFKNVADQVPETHQLLPVEYKALQKAEADVEAAGGYREYVFEPSSSEVLNELLPAYVEALIYRAMLESAAAEQGARRTAMKSATDNASDMITTLTRSYNRARQDAISTEIAEIVGGAAAQGDQS
ncbi:MAG: ATP synthase F1 subunit gamma [Coriobacteriia bacterium]|nr:ATP synthase F1 subunit gamma [Coriobacteriia bacterium]